MDVRGISYVSLFAALGVSLRIFKHLIVGPIQFINFPMVISILYYAIRGKYFEALFSGILVFIVTDFIIGFGPWTLTNSLSLIASLTLIVPFKGLHKTDNLIGLGILVYIVELIYDLLSSILGYLWFLGGYEILLSLKLAVVGLFLPAGGGSLFLVGPTTELFTAITVLSLTYSFKKFRVISVG